MVVNTWPTSRWLGEQLAAVNGISALVRFPFPGSRLRQLVHAVLGADEAGDDPWRAERLVWTVLKVLPDLLEHDGAAACVSGGNAITARLDSSTETNGNWRGASPMRWTTMRCMAAGTAEWLAGESGTTLPEGLQWQPVLARAIAEQLPCQPFGLQVQQAVLKLRDGQQPAQPLPPRLRLFGVSNLAPVQVNLLQALAGHISVELFLLTPCPDLCSARNGADVS